MVEFICQSVDVDSRRSERWISVTSVGTSGRTNWSSMRTNHEDEYGWRKPRIRRG